LTPRRRPAFAWQPGWPSERYLPRCAPRLRRPIRQAQHEGCLSVNSAVSRDLLQQYCQTLCSVCCAGRQRTGAHAASAPCTARTGPAPLPVKHRRRHCLRPCPWAARAARCARRGAERGRRSRAGAGRAGAAARRAPRAGRAGHPARALGQPAGAQRALEARRPAPPRPGRLRAPGRHLLLPHPRLQRAALRNAPTHPPGPPHPRHQPGSPASTCGPAPRPHTTPRAPPTPVTSQAVRAERAVHTQHGGP